MARRHLPAGGLLLTAGVDVQRDRLEASVWAWGQDRQSWLVEHRVLAGNPFEAAVWEELRLLLGESWRHASGHRLPVAMAAIDSGDGITTAEVYAFVRRAGAGRAIAVKGQDGLRAAVGQPTATEVRRNGRKLGGLKLWPVGSSFLKGETYGWLKLDRPTAESGDPFPPGYVHLPIHAAGEESCRQLAAERLVARAGRNGFRRLEWVKTRERNEALDCRVYARAAASALGMDGWGDGRWARMADALSLPAPERATAATPGAPPVVTRPQAWLAPRGGWLRWTAPGAWQSFAFCSSLARRKARSRPIRRPSRWLGCPRRPWRRCAPRATAPARRTRIRRAPCATPCSGVTPRCR